MKRDYLIIFCLSSIVVSLNTSAQTKYDIFPLAKYLHYSYSFYQQFEIRDLGYPTELESDSGKVEYIIRDSVKYSDTLIIWNVEQRQNLLHTRYFGSQSTYLLDTVYSIIDTTYFSLYELLAGNHELKCSSLVWHFPTIVWPSNYVLPSPDSSIYRYSDSTKVFYFISKSDNDGWKDSIWFKNEYGMYQRMTNSYSIHISQYYYTLNVKQIDKPTEVEKRNVDRITHFTLYQNYPNPFNPSTTIKYSLSRSSNIILELYDILGRKLLDIDAGFRVAGEHIVTLKIDNLPSGVYFYKLSSSYYSITKKLVLLR
jgi:hypothetical protein